MQPQQSSPFVSQHDSTIPARNGTERPEAQPTLRVVPPSSSSIAPRVEIDFRHLDDGRVVELIEDPSDATKTKLAVFEGGKVSVVDEIDYRGQVLVPIGRATDGLEDISLPRAPQPYKSVEEVFFHVYNLMAVCVALPSEYLLLAAAVVLNSWFGDRLRPPAYLLATGLPQSGKTTLLEMMRLLCRRSLLVSDITVAAAYQACSRFGCTLLIDENDWSADRNSRTLRKQLRAGTSKGLLARHLGKTQHAYGTKVLSSVELPDDPALRSRCVHIPMSETDRADLRKPWDPELAKVADVVRGQLLQLRLERYASVSPRLIPGAEKLRPRSRDLLSTLLAPVSGEELIEQSLLEVFVLIHDPSTRDLLSPEQAVVVAALFLFIHGSPGAESVQIKVVANLANLTLHALGERLQLTPRKCSNLLASLGFGYRDRSNRGSFLYLNKEVIAKVHKLKLDHAVTVFELGGWAMQTENCTLCEHKTLPTPTEPKG